MPDSLNDEEMVKGLKQGLMASRTEFARRFGPCLKLFLKNRFVSSDYDAEEIIQDTFYKAIINIQRYDPARGAKFSTWVFQIAKNTARDWLKKKKRLEFLSWDDNETQQNLPTVQEQDEELSREGILLREAMSHLDITDRVILEHYSHDVKLFDIARYMGMKEGTVRQRKRRALEKLKTTYETIKAK